MCAHSVTLKGLSEAKVEKIKVYNTSLSSLNERILDWVRMLSQSAWYVAGSQSTEHGALYHF